MSDNFHNRHILAHTINQLQAQKLARNIWIGPLNSVVQQELLASNNIKYIIGILPAQKCCYYLRDHINSNFCCVSIDPDFNIHKLTEDEADILMKFNSQFTPAITQITENKISNAIITNTSFQKLTDDFLVLIKSIQEKDPNAGILVFSLNGNDNLLASFAMCYVQDSHNCDVPASYSYLKSVRPSVAEFDQDGFFIAELLKFQTANKARKMYGTPNTGKTKRSASDAIEHLSHESPRCSKRAL